MAANLVAPAAAQRFVDPRTGIITVPWQQFLANLTTAASGSGVTSFNTRVGAVTLNGTDVSTALGYTPYDSANPAGYITAAGAPVQSVAGKTGVVTLAVADVSGAAPLASPTFTGTPAAPTAAPGTNTTQIATTAFVETAVSGASVTSFDGRTGAVSLLVTDATGGIVGYANVKAYGAVGNGIADDTAEIQSAINSGFPVYFPPGTYRITSALTATNVSLTLIGAGPNASTIRQDGAADGITFNGSWTSFAIDQLVVRDLKFLANNASCAAAIHGIWTSTGGTDGQPRTCYVQNVSCVSANGGPSWAAGVSLAGGDNAAIRDCYITTYNFAGAFRAGSYGILITANGTNDPAFEVDIANVTFYQCATAIGFNVDATAANNICQGLFVNHCHIINCSHGVAAGNAAAVPAGPAIEPEIVITNSFIGTQVLGVDIQAQAQFNVSGNLFYGQGALNWIGIQYTSINGGGYQVDGRIHDNTLIALSGGTTAGIKIIGNAGASESIAINANTFEACTNAATLDANTTGVIFTISNYIISGGGVSNSGSSSTNIIDSRGQTTPVPTAGSGAFATVSSVVDYEKIGRFAKCRVTITDTNNGTAASFIALVMPFTATSESVFYGRAVSSGKMVQGIMAATSSTMQVLLYDNTYPGATGERITLEGMIFV